MWLFRCVLLVLTGLAESRQPVIGWDLDLPCVLMGPEFNHCGNMRVIKTGSLGTAKGSRTSLRLTNDYKPAALSPNSEKGRENIEIWRYGKDIQNSNDYINLDGELKNRSTKISQKSENNLAMSSKSQILISHVWVFLLLRCWSAHNCPVLSVRAYLIYAHCHHVVSKGTTCTVKGHLSAQCWLDCRLLARGKMIAQCISAPSFTLGSAMWVTSNEFQHRPLFLSNQWFHAFSNEKPALGHFGGNLFPWHVWS